MNQKLTELANKIRSNGPLEILEGKTVVRKDQGFVRGYVASFEEAEAAEFFVEAYKLLTREAWRERAHVLEGLDTFE